MIEFFSTEFEKFSRTLEGYVKPLSWTDSLEKLTLPVVKKSESAEFAEGITKQLTSNMDAGRRDEIVSADKPAPEVKPDFKRPEVIGILPNWILTLRAYTVSLKNLENLSREDKERHLKKILQGWSTVMLYACIVFKEVVERKTLEVGPLKFAINMPEGFDARVLRIMFVHIPVAVSDWLRRDLGSRKLVLQLKNDSLSDSLSDVFLQTSLYADLKLDEYLGQMKALKEKVSKADSQMFMEFMLVKMRDIFLRLGLHHNEESGFLNLAAEISAAIKGLEGDEKAKEIDRFSNSLRKQGQVKQLRDNLA